MIVTRNQPRKRTARVSVAIEARVTESMTLPLRRRQKTRNEKTDEAVVLQGRCKLASGSELVSDCLRLD
jgi:hypothetical protein